MCDNKYKINQKVYTYDEKEVKVLIYVGVDRNKKSLFRDETGEVDSPWNSDFYKTKEEAEKACKEARIRTLKSNIKVCIDRYEYFKKELIADEKELAQLENS